MFFMNHFFYFSRYEELWDYIWKIDNYVQKGFSYLRKHGKDLPTALSKPFNVLSAYLYMKKNFDDHQKARQKQLEETTHFLNKINDVGELRDCYDYLRLR